MLCNCLNARDAAEGQLATDILIAAIEDGRLAGPELGAILREFLGTGIIRPKRWVPRLKDTAAVSPLHAQCVRILLETALAGDWQPLPRDYAALLEVLLDLLVSTGEVVAPGRLHSALDAMKGSGKGPKLARKILALAPGDSAATRRSAAATALEHRIQRVKRWQGP